MQQASNHSRNFHIPASLWLVIGAALLAAEPLQWLARSWIAPAYDSNGEWLALLVIALLLWSASSSRTGHSTPNHRGWYLLLATAGLRLIGQVLAINIVSAMALVIDVYAIGLILGLNHRRRSLSPFWLAALFACALPLETLLQRVGGYGLQQLSASGACAVLNLFSSVIGDTLQCSGTQISLAGKQLLIDLPCSGARGLLMLVSAFCAIAAVKRPSLSHAVIGALITAVAAILGNMLRLAFIAMAWAKPELLGGADVMAEPWHGYVGTAALAISAVPLIMWARRLPIITSAPYAAADKKRGPTKKLNARFTFLFPLCAIAVLLVPAQPLDAEQDAAPQALPRILAGHFYEKGRLSEKEQQYFTQWGGQAQRGYYGPFTLLRVSTRAPLRHLHSPAACLGGNGNELRYVGRFDGAMPSARYQLTDVEGQQWQVLVSYVSDRGEWATDVAAVSWNWMRSGGQSRWTMLQRIAPLQQTSNPEGELTAPAFKNFNNNIVAALDLNTPDTKLRFDTPTPNQTPRSSNSLAAHPTGSSASNGHMNTPFHF